MMNFGMGWVLALVGMAVMSLEGTIAFSIPSPVLRGPGFSAARSSLARSRPSVFRGGSKVCYQKASSEAETTNPEPIKARKSAKYDIPQFDFDFENSAVIVREGEQQVMPEDMLKLIKEEAESLESHVLIARQLKHHVLNKNRLRETIASILANKLCNSDLPAVDLYDVLDSTMKEHPKLVWDAVQDLLWIKEVDPATLGYLQPLMYFKGFHAIVAQRISHKLWLSGDQGDKYLALTLQSRSSEMFGVDAHPGAKIAHAVMFDHATGIVVGETATIGHNCYILHGVTLGATGKAGEFDRHPKVGNGVKIGAGSYVLGNIPIEDGVVIGASAIVTVPVATGETVVGINRILDSKQRDKAAGKDMDMDIWMYNI